METALTAIQVAAILAVAIVAYAHLRVIRLLGRQLGAQAEAMVRAIDLGQAQRRDAARPVLTLGLRTLEGDAEPTTARFRLTLTNAGTGPAFDVVVTPVGMPALAEVAAPASDGASHDLVAVGQTLALDFTASPPSRRGARPVELGASQPAGELLVAYRDAFNRERTTRARLVTTRELGDDGAYGLRIASQTFGE